MPIATTDMLLKLSTTAGAAGNANAGTPGNSLGKYISTTVLSGTPLNNLFPDITGAENAASQLDYQCVFVHNAHASLTATNVVAYGTGDVSGGAVPALGVDTTAASALAATGAQALQIANRTTAPAGVSFTETDFTDTTGISLGSIAPGQVKAFWVRRSAANTSAVNNDGFTIAVAFDTAA